METTTIRRWAIGDVINAPNHGTAIIWTLDDAGEPTAILFTTGFAAGIIASAPRTLTAATDPGRIARAKAYGRAEWTRRGEGTQRRLMAERDAEDNAAMAAELDLDDSNEQEAALAYAEMTETPADRAARLRALYPAARPGRARRSR